MANTTIDEFPVRVGAGRVTLEGNLSVPEGARGVVLFAHGSGSGRHSPRNRFVSHELVSAGLGTLLIDLLTEEERAEMYTRHLRFDIGLEWALGRLGSHAKWLEVVPGATHLFEERGVLEEVARLAAGWFTRYLVPADQADAT